VELKLHAFLTSALDGGEWSALRPYHLTFRKRAHATHWIGGGVGPRAGLDAVVKRKIPSPCQVLELLIIQLLAEGNVRFYFLSSNAANRYSCSVVLCIDSVQVMRTFSGYGLDVLGIKPVSYPVDTGGSFPCDKVATIWRDLECVDIYLHYPINIYCMMLVVLSN
jgi:hypothetical protein